MYLSRVILNLNNPEARRDLVNCHDLHSRIMSAFPFDSDLNGHAREAYGILYRTEFNPRDDATQLLVQSNVEPNWEKLPPNYTLSDEPSITGSSCKQINAAYASITNDSELVFRLRANPTRRVSKNKGPNDPLSGKRVELQSEDEWIDWMKRKGEQGGFIVLAVQARSDTSEQERVRNMYGLGTSIDLTVPDLRSSEGVKVHGYKRRERRGEQRRRLTFGSVLFDGRLRVVDAPAFQSTLRTGIGAGKAYGFGLLSVARI